MAVERYRDEIGEDPVPWQRGEVHNLPIRRAGLRCCIKRAKTAQTLVACPLESLYDKFFP